MKIISKLSGGNKEDTMAFNSERNNGLWSLLKNIWYILRTKSRKTDRYDKYRIDIKII